VFTEAHKISLEECGGCRGGVIPPTGAAAGLKPLPCRLGVMAHHQYSNQPHFK